MSSFNIKIIKRTSFIRVTALAAAGIFLGPATRIRVDSRIKAVVFDAFPLFDPASLFKPVGELFPEQAKQVIELWQLKQFSYQWLRLTGGQYKNFWDIARDALDFTLRQKGLYPDERRKDFIMAGYNHMHAWPDALPALEILKKDGLKICILSNMTAGMLQQGIQNSALTGLFDFVISTDENRTYKPARKAYQMAVGKLKLRKEEILFVPFAGWDLAGAKWFGFPTFWVNRINSNSENLDAEPDGIGANLDDLVSFTRAQQR